MGLSVVTNVSALAAHRGLTLHDAAMSRSLERLSSGNRINRAADDAAGLGIAQNLRVQVSGMGQAIRNAQDGINVVQTADGALGSATAILQRLRDLSVQAANDGVLAHPAKPAIQAEVAQLKAELTRIAEITTFGGRPLLDGSFSGTFQIGANRGDTLTVVIGSPGSGFDVAGLGLASLDVTGTTTLGSTVTPAISDQQGVPTAGSVLVAGDYVGGGVYPATFEALAGSITYEGKTFDLGSVDYTGAVTATDYLNRLNAAAQPFFGLGHTPFTGSAGGLTFTGATPAVGSTVVDAAKLTPSYAGRSGASAALPLLDEAINRISTLRADLGAIQNRLDHSIAGLQVTMENTTASVSRIADADMAAEMAAFTRNQILSQAGTAMLSQTLRRPEGVLALLR